MGTNGCAYEVTTQIPAALDVYLTAHCSLLFWLQEHLQLRSAALQLHPSAIAAGHRSRLFVALH